ncbi:uncharacterized protein LOC105388765 [Plutella xylostella]|uniref:uncharacterized protein LOC105388765 n=1 Tax=Plutella xylostella TaxID=51655 RepID=UPI0020322A8B|nr:uncharacterized protein LOC105388765 [Plutella xylostella]
MECENVLKLDPEIAYENYENYVKALIENEKAGSTYANCESKVEVPSDKHSFNVQHSLADVQITATPLLPNMDSTNKSTKLEYFTYGDIAKKYDLESDKVLEEISFYYKEQGTETVIEVENNTYERLKTAIRNDNREMWNDEAVSTDHSKTLDNDIEMYLKNWKVTNPTVNNNSFVDVEELSMNHSKKITSLNSTVYETLDESTKSMLDEVKMDKFETCWSSYQTNFYSWINTQYCKPNAVLPNGNDIREADEIEVISLLSDEDITHIQDEVESECSGYHSSDFEFISEDEAKRDGMVINFRTKDLGKPISEKRAHHRSEVVNIEISKIDNNIRNDVHNGNKPENTGHVIPEGDAYYHLFSGLYNPTLIRHWENKTITNNCSNPMLIEIDGVGFDNAAIRKMNRIQKVSKELKKEAADCKKRILELYPEENKRFRRF